MIPKYRPKATARPGPRRRNRQRRTVRRSRGGFAGARNRHAEGEATCGYGPANHQAAGRTTGCSVDRLDDLPRLLTRTGDLGDRVVSTAPFGHWPFPPLSWPGSSSPGLVPCCPHSAWSSRTFPPRMMRFPAETRPAHWPLPPVDGSTRQPARIPCRPDQPIRCHELLDCAMNRTGSDKRQKKTQRDCRDHVDGRQYHADPAGDARQPGVLLRCRFGLGHAQGEEIRDHVVGLLDGDGAVRLENLPAATTTPELIKSILLSMALP